MKVGSKLREGGGTTCRSLGQGLKLGNSSVGKVISKTLVTLANAAAEKWFTGKIFFIAVLMLNLQRTHGIVEAKPSTKTKRIGD